MAVGDYLKKIERALKAGNATEHTHRPALKSLVEELRPGLTATNEPQRIECGSPDFIIVRGATPLGYIEAKDVGVDLDKAQKSEQLKRYRDSLRNLILTDYLEFRLYRTGELVQSTQLAKWQKNGVLRRDDDAIRRLPAFLDAFFDAEVPTIGSPRELAERMARLARLLHDLIKEAFAHEGAKGDLHSQFEAFKKVLITDLSVDQFADMYAQTIAYGLFAARCNHSGTGFTREHAGRELPKTNPFLRKLFNTIAGADLDERISWAVDDLAQLLAKADMAAVLEDFGRATRQHDPVVHFYETFLAAYDQKLREMRGVYYTPEPVVSYIVRSVDTILRTSFELKSGLADRTTVRLQIQTPHAKKKTKDITTHRVQILDPACGTGTFLRGVVAQIQSSFKGGKGLWPAYVADHLLPRVYGFELLMAPYAVAHMKLGLQLQDSGYDFAADERLRVFLTNSLEEGHEFAGLPLFAQWLADEAAAASEVKREVPIMVVLGNPPYSGHSVNKGAWIEKLVEQYKRSAELRKPAQAKWLSDDYVKFVRFAQWRIEQTGYGVLGFVTNHSYLDNPTFLDMRASLMSTFDDIYVIDLHGSSKKKEVTPSGGKDENVFDIQQGVAICLMVRKNADSRGTRTVHHAHLWGERPTKYEWLEAHGIEDTKWTAFAPEPPRYLFVPQDRVIAKEYEAGWSIIEAMNPNGDPAPGIVTTHDEFAISWTREEAIGKVKKFLRTESEAEARSLWRLCSQDQWNYARAKQELASNDWMDRVVPIMYRPFDVRWTVYDRNVAVHRRERVMNHMLQPNLALITARSNKSPQPDHFFCAAMPVETKCGESTTQSTTIPLFLYTNGVDTLFSSDASGKSANFSAAFVSDVSARLGFRPTPNESFAYIYSILFSPAFRTRYADFLKRDYPRVPFTSDKGLFKKLVRYGEELIALHTMQTAGRDQPDYPVAGDNLVDKISFDDEHQRLYINAEQYFEPVEADVWHYRIGGYAVAQKWLTYRKGRLLTFAELDHFRRFISALRRTLEIQAAIDEQIPAWPLR